MRIELESTTQIISVDGRPCRVWSGKTSAGVAIFALVASVSPLDERDAPAFERELLERIPVATSRGERVTIELPTRLELVPRDKEPS